MPAAQELWGYLGVIKLLELPIPLNVGRNSCGWQRLVVAALFLD
jgi:hypothetical protein